MLHLLAFSMRRQKTMALFGTAMPVLKYLLSFLEGKNPEAARAPPLDITARFLQSCPQPRILTSPHATSNLSAVQLPATSAAQNANGLPSAAEVRSTPHDPPQQVQHGRPKETR